MTQANTENPYVNLALRAATIGIRLAPVITDLAHTVRQEIHDLWGSHQNESTPMNSTTATHDRQQSDATTRQAENDQADHTNRILSAEDWPRLSWALGQTESSNNPEAWGDHGIAMGRWQMHPAFFDRWKPPAALLETWDAWAQRTLRRWFAHAIADASTIEEAIAGFHLHGSTEGDPSKCPEYIAAFRRNWQAYQQ